MPVSKVSTVFVVLLATFARTRAVTLPRFCKVSSTCKEKDGERCGKNFKGIGFVAFDEEKTDKFLFYDIQGIKYGACTKAATEQTTATANETTMAAQTTNKPIETRNKPVETPKKEQGVINRLLAPWTHVYA